MSDNGHIRQTLLSLREAANVSQADLARRLPFTASRVSRLEAGEIALSVEDAEQIAEAIGSPRAKDFASYLRQDWVVLERPGFNHPDREVLWEAEQALQRLNALEGDPELKNAFVQQVMSCRHAIERAATYLLSTEHPIAFLGSPGVGKTSMICTLADLRNRAEKDLNRQMALQTGSGRTTACEVHLRNGSEYSLIVEPCSTDELRQYIGDFCDSLIGTARGSDGSADGAGISAEVERALRNMTGLTRKSIKRADGKTSREDPALELVKQYPTKEDLLVEIQSRLEISRRTRTSITFPRESMTPSLDWIAKTFAEINYGRHPEFSLPRRIEVTVPQPLLGSTDLELRLIDTRGIDEPSAPRRDLQAYLDSDRTVVVLCSGFKDAPDAAMLAVIERATEAGLRDSIREKGLLVVLPQDGEEAGVRDNSTGDTVSTPEEGRDIRRDQITTTLGHVGTRDLAVEFLNIRDDADRDGVRDTLLRLVGRRRSRYAEQISNLVSTVDRLIANKANEQVKAVFASAIRPIQVWFANNRELPQNEQKVQAALLEEIDGLRYVASLRASVNRHGDWHNFDYWHSLGFGTRRETVARAAEQVTVLKGQIATALNDADLELAHDFLRHFQSEVETAVAEFYLDVQTLGETAFLEQLRSDTSYWTKCYGRWGGGPGYKIDIRRWTEAWFSEAVRKDRYEFIEAEVQRRWRDVIDRLDGQLATAGTDEPVAAA